MTYRPDDIFKPLDECRSGAEFRILLDKSIEAGTWKGLAKDIIIPYVIYDITNPDHIREYADCGIPPEKAWQMEIMITPEHNGKLELLSPIRLGHALHKAKVEHAVYDAISKGARTPLRAILELRQTHPDISDDEINEVFDDAIIQGILG